MKRFVLFFISFVFAVSVATTVSFGYVKADEVVVIDDLTVHFIDVGQGDACIVELPDNRTMLIDAGENKTAVRTKLDSYINDNIKDSNGNVYFDFVIMTHSDSDHIGSMEHVLTTYDVHTVYRPNQACTYNDCDDPAGHGEGAYGFWGDKQGTKSTATYHKVLESAYENAEEVIVTNPYDNSQNQITSTNDKAYTINFYSPISPFYSDNNNYSPIIVIEYNGRKIVVTGDAEKENEAEFVKAVKDGDGRYAAFKDFSADVIKLGHHGSRTSSSEDYLNVVTKAALRSGVFVIISCGEGNSYGHPHPEILERLASLGFIDDNILRTDKLGDIVISISKIGGEYKAVYDGRAGADNAGSSGQGNQEQDEEKDIVTLIREWFNSLDTYKKIIVVVIIVIVVALVVYLLVKPALKKNGKNNNKNSNSKGKGKKK